MTHYFILLLFSAIGMISDIKTYKISNRLLLFLFIPGVIYIFEGYGYKHLIAYLLGMLIPFGLVFPAFILKKIGASDIKMLMIIELLIGPENIINYMIIFFVCGIVEILIYSFQHKKKTPLGIAFMAASFLFMLINIIQNLGMLHGGLY